MSGKRYRPEEIIAKLREAYVLISQGGEDCRWFQPRQLAACRKRIHHGVSSLVPPSG